MFETPITVVGRIVSDPKRRTVGNRDVVKFRLASNARWRTGDGTWEQGDSLFVNVNCWGRLVTGVAGSLKRGDAVIVVGHIYTNEYEDREGVRRSSLELRATAVGPDLAHYIATLRKVGEPAGPDQSTPGTRDGHSGVDSAEDRGEQGGPLPLSA